MTSASDEALATLASLDGLLVNGMVLAADVGGAVTGLNVVRTINGAPTLTLGFEDEERKVLRSGIFARTTTIRLAPFTFETVAVSKQGNGITITAEDQVVTALRSRTDPYKVAAGKMTHVEFAARLASEIPWLKFITDPVSAAKAVRSKTELTRGSPTSPTSSGSTESSWDALNRNGGDRGWRVFVRGVDELWYVPDEYLLTLPSDTLTEDSETVDDIDFDFDQGKPIAQMTANVRSALWGLPPGSPCAVMDLGPANGVWVLQDVTKEATSTTSALTLVQPQPILPEPDASNNAAGGSRAVADTAASAGDAAAPNLPGASGSRDHLQFVETALSQIGKAYVLGSGPSPSNVNPTSFDCSGLVHWSAGRVGISLPRTSLAQRDFCRSHNTLIPIERAVRIRGALMFEQTGSTHHVAISLGDGSKTIEAMGRAYGVNEEAIQNRGWTDAALVPGMKY